MTIDALLVHNVIMSPSVPGAQLVDRIAFVLRIVSASMPQGLSTSQVARETGLARPTAHRILTSLTANGFVDHDVMTGNWHLGPELYLMGTVAAERYDITPIARESLHRLAASTGESAFLSARRGNETVCLLREDGAFPIRSFVLYEGIRFPLGVASAGLAILSMLGDAEIDRYLARVELTERFGPAHASAALRKRITATRQSGYAVNPGLIVTGSWGMGATIFDARGEPAWALSLTGVESRFGADRRPELGRLLLEEAHRITQRLRRTAKG
jgi:DNA-binding IclR family transcriptional regulator